MKDPEEVHAKGPEEAHVKDPEEVHARGPEEYGCDTVRGAVTCRALYRWSDLYW